MFLTAMKYNSEMEDFKDNDVLSIIPDIEEKSSSTKRALKDAEKGNSPTKKQRRMQNKSAKKPAMMNTLTGRWTKDEHEKFLDGIRIYGKEWKKIASMIDTRTVVQIRTHAQKYFQKLAKKRNQALNGGISNSKKNKKNKKNKSDKKVKNTAVSTSNKKYTTKDGTEIPFKVSLNLCLQLPEFDGSKDTAREASPTSVADFGNLELNNESFGNDSTLQVEEEEPLTNWLNDVQFDAVSDSSDSCTSSPLDTSDTIYVDTRCGGLEGSVLSNLETYEFEAEDTFPVENSNLW
jgi:SHAQKYF class myb-like DNA-binding protein